MSKLAKKQQGVSLLEIMFVLAIMMVMTIGAFVMVTQYEKTLRAKQMAVQVRAINQAALSYYNTFGYWPNRIIDLVRLHYLAPQPGEGKNAPDYYNPWRNPYSMLHREKLGTRGNLADAHLYLKHYTYFSYHSRIPKVELQRALALLPFAQVNLNYPGTSVGRLEDDITLSIPMPGQGLNQNPDRVQYMATVTVKEAEPAHIPVPTCVTQNYVPEIVYAVTSFCTSANGSGSGCVTGKMLHNVGLSCSRNNNSYYTLNLKPGYVTGLLFSSAQVDAEPETDDSDTVDFSENKIDLDDSSSSLTSYDSLNRNSKQESYDPTGSGNLNISGYAHINRTEALGDNDYCNTGDYCTTNRPIYAFKVDSANGLPGPSNVVIKNSTVDLEHVEATIGDSTKQVNSNYGTPTMTADTASGNDAEGQIFVTTRCVPAASVPPNNGSDSCMPNGVQGSLGLNPSQLAAGQQLSKERKAVGASKF